MIDNFGNIEREFETDKSIKFAHDIINKFDLIVSTDNIKTINGLYQTTFAIANKDIQYMGLVKD